MRFKKGDKVEVMNKKETLTSWRCAEIISGNGHTYSVRYDCCSGQITEQMVERVSRKGIRPYPTQIRSAECWVTGDVVEVFDENSWKIASVLKVCGGDYYVVRTLGLNQEFRVHKLNIRMRQSWQDDQWAVIGKGPGSCMDVKPCKVSNSNYQNRFHIRQSNAKFGGHNSLASHTNNNGLQESHKVSSKMLKRPSPYCSSLLEANTQKTRAIEEEGRIKRVDPTPFSRKVDSCEPKWRKLIARSSEPNDCDSDDCSVGSCSVINRNPSPIPNRFSTHFVPFSCGNRDTLCSDDEEESSALRDEEVLESVHRLELHAYRCTLEALYASGPLSWEKEALLTNLRITLNISNDEHLMELRNLISSGTAILR